MYSPINNWYRVEDVLEDVEVERINVKADNETVSLGWTVPGVGSEGW